MSDEREWCLSNVDPEVPYGPYPSKAVATATAYSLRLTGRFGGKGYTLGRVQYACPVRDGQVSFRDIMEMIDDNAGDDGDFGWVEDAPIFQDPERFKEVSLAFEAFMRAIVSSKYWIMADDGQEFVPWPDGAVEG